MLQTWNFLGAVRTWQRSEVPISVLFTWPIGVYCMKFGVDTLKQCWDTDLHPVGIFVLKYVLTLWANGLGASAYATMCGSNECYAIAWWKDCTHLCHCVICERWVWHVGGCKRSIIHEQIWNYVHVLHTPYNYVLVYTAMHYIHQCVA